MLFADYHGGAPEAYSVACFIVMIIASGGIAAWLRFLQRRGQHGKRATTIGASLGHSPSEAAAQPDVY